MTRKTRYLSTVIMAILMLGFLQNSNAQSKCADIALEIENAKSDITHQTRVVDKQQVVVSKSKIKVKISLSQLNSAKAQEASAKLTLAKSQAQYNNILKDCDAKKQAYYEAVSHYNEMTQALALAQKNYNTARSNYEINCSADPDTKRCAILRNQLKAAKDAVVIASKILVGIGCEL